MASAQVRDAQGRSDASCQYTRKRHTYSLMRLTLGASLCVTASPRPIFIDPFDCVGASLVRHLSASPIAFPKPDAAMFLGSGPLPAQIRHDRGDPPLISRAQPIDRFEVQRRLGDRQDGGAADAGEMIGDGFLPGIAFIAIRLFRLGVVAFERLPSATRPRLGGSSSRPRQTVDRDPWPARRCRCLSFAPARIAGHRFRRADKRRGWWCRRKCSAAVR